MTARHWRAQALLRESLRNALNLRSRAIISLAVAIAAGSAAISFYAFESATFRQRVEDLETRGSNVLALQSAVPSTDVAISRSSCEALTRLPEVERSGLLIDSGTLDIPEIGARTRIFQGSTTLFPELVAQEGVLGSTLARTESPRTITVAPSRTRWLVVATPQPAGIPTNSAIVFPLPANTSSGPACIVELTRFNSPKTLAPLLAAALGVRGGPLIGNPQLVLPTDPVQDWRTRPGQYLPLALGILGGLLTSTVTSTRSSELSAYRLSGTSRRSMGILLTLESLFPAGAFLLAGAIALTTVSLSGTLLVSAPEQLFWMVAGAAGWSAAAATGVLRSVLGSPAKMTREK